MLAVEMDGKAEMPFIVLLGRGDCGLATVRESLEATEAASTLLLRLKSPIFAVVRSLLHLAEGQPRIECVVYGIIW